MGKARIYGMVKPAVPNAKADSRRKKPLGASGKKGRKPGRVSHG